jgi:sugar/nucleoside kinase (ribokinase family)
MAAAGVFVGLATLDVIQHVEAPPRANEKVTARAQWIVAGGPATNAAVTFAALGGEAVLITALGRGPAADMVRTDLGRCGVSVVDVSEEAVDQVSVSSITVVRSTGERSVVSTDAGNTRIGNLPDLREVVDAAEVLLVDGHHPALAGAAARLADETTRPLVVDAGRWRPVMERLVPSAAVVICSADFRWPGTTSVQSSAQAVVDRGVRTVIVTRGADPVLWWHGPEHGAVEPPRIAAVDTAGAGDVFHGAYCYFTATSEGPHVDRLTRSSCEVAALSCRYPGTRSWLDHLPDLAAG